MMDSKDRKPKYSHGRTSTLPIVSLVGKIVVVVVVIDVLCLYSWVPLALLGRGSCCIKEYTLNVIHILAGQMHLNHSTYGNSEHVAHEKRDKIRFVTAIALVKCLKQVK